MCGMEVDMRVPVGEVNRHGGIDHRNDARPGGVAMGRDILPAVLSFVLALGLVVAGILGPLGIGVIRFHMTELVENQYLGGEIVTLFVAAPVLAVAGLLWLRGSPLAALLAFGPALYTMYTFITVIVGQEYARFSGNAGNAFVLYVALIAGSFLLVLLAAARVLALPTPEIPRGERMALGITFLGIVAFFALAWSGQIALVYRGDPPAEYVDSPTLFWLIKMLDLGFLLPAFALAGVGVLRRQAVPVRVAAGMTGYAVCMSAAILGMAIAMHLKGDPSASAGMILFLTPACAGLAWLEFRLLRLYRRSEGRWAVAPTAGAGHATT